MKRAVDQMKIAIVRISKFASVMNQHVHKFSVDTSEAVQVINMPSIMNAKQGSIDKWLKKEGQTFKEGEELCEVTLSDFTIAIDAPKDGIVTEIFAKPGVMITVNQPILSFANNTNSYWDFLDKKKIESHDDELLADVTELKVEKSKQPDSKVLLKEIKHMIQKGLIVEGSDFARQLQSLARKGNAELLSAFNASFEGNGAFDEETFDSAFFIENASDIIRELNSTNSGSNGGGYTYSSLNEIKVRSKDEHVGLSNQGATCYLNGLLQTLFMTPEFRRAIFTWNYNPIKDGVAELCIPLQLQKLFGLLQLSYQKSVDTKALTKSFGWEGFEVFQQQDVQELTRVLFDALEETFKGTEVENIIDELYAGELVDYIRCIDVDYQSERVDKFLDFSLAIVPFENNEKPLKNLNECIELFLKPEILNGENKYYAEKFNQKVDAIKGLKFGKLPQIMAVQLKRFVYDFTGPNIVQKKLNYIVKFPFILDMNKYVSKKKCNKNTSTSTSEKTDEVSSTLDVDHVENINDEFEEFLLQQIKNLTENNNKENNNNNNNSCSDNDTIDYKADAKDYNTSSKYSNDNNNEDDDEETDPNMPDLVDINGNKSPDQLLDEEEARWYDELEPSELETLLKTRGEWIYELYAVLIHSGAISGGHYFAYIKDLDTKKWWNFNDSNVTEIDEKTVKEAWGSKTTTTTTYSTYNSLNNIHNNNLYNGLYQSRFPNSNNNSTTIQKTTTTLNNSNAYMLMYRKLSMKIHSLKDSSSSFSSCKDLSVRFPDDSLVPEYIKKAVEEERLRKEKKLLEEEETRNRLQIKVFTQNSDFTVDTKRTHTLIDFLRIIWNDKLNLKNEIVDFNVSSTSNNATSTTSTITNEEALNVSDKILNEDEIKLAFGEEVDITFENNNENSNTNDNAHKVSNDAADANNTTAVFSTDSLWQELPNIEKEIVDGIISNDNNSNKNSYNFNIDLNSNNTNDDLNSQDETIVVNNNKINTKNNINTTTTYSTSSSLMTTNTSDANNSPLYFLNFIRLRNYVQHSKTATEVYEVDISGSKTLQELSFAEYKYYFLETRKSQQEEWEVYYLDGLTVLLEEFDSLTCSFKEPINVRVPKFFTVYDLKVKISSWVSYDIEKIRILKFSPFYNNDLKVEDLNEGRNRLKEDCCVFDGSKLYFEEKASDDLNDSLAYATYVNAKNQLEIKYNKPPSTTCDLSLSVDLRWTVEDLRKLLAKETNIDVTELKLSRFEGRGLEIKDGQLLSSLNLSYNTTVFLSIGKSAPYGYFNLVFVKYVAADVKTGSVPLPLVEDINDCIYNDDDVENSNADNSSSGKGDMISKLDYWKKNQEDEFNSNNDTSLLDDFDSESILLNRQDNFQYKNIMTSIKPCKATAHPLKNLNLYNNSSDIINSSSTNQYGSNIKNFSTTQISSMLNVPLNKTMTTPIPTPIPLYSQQEIDNSKNNFDDLKKEFLNVAEIGLMNNNENDYDDDDVYDDAMFNNNNNNNNTKNGNKNNNNNVNIINNIKSNDEHLYENVYDFADYAEEDVGDDNASNQGVVDTNEFFSITEDENENDQQFVFDEGFPSSPSLLYNGIDTTATTTTSSKNEFQKNVESKDNFYNESSQNNNDGYEDYNDRNNNLDNTVDNEQKISNISNYATALNVSPYNDDDLMYETELVEISSSSDLNSHKYNCVEATIKTEIFDGYNNNNNNGNRNGDIPETRDRPSIENFYDDVAAEKETICFEKNIEDQKDRKFDNTLNASNADSGNENDNDVEPSEFGQLMVRNMASTGKLIPEVLPNPIFASPKNTFLEIKIQLVANLIENGTLPPTATTNSIRLRETTSTSVTKILRDKKTILETTQIYDNKNFAFEVLDREEALDIDNEMGSVIVSVQRWNRSTWDLSERFEVNLPGNLPISDIAKRLAVLVGINNVKNLAALIVALDSEIFLSKLNSKAPSLDQTKSWFEPWKESKLLRFNSHGIRIQDGDLLLLQDVTEPLKELSKNDLKSIEIVEAANKPITYNSFNSNNSSYNYNNYNSSSTYGFSNSAIDTAFNYGVIGSSFNAPTTTTITPSKFSSSNGIKIKTHKERVRDEEKLQIQISNNNNNNTSVVVNDNNYSGGGGVGSITADDDFYNFENNGTITTTGNDVDEFKKGGGFAIFDDIINS